MRACKGILAHNEENYRLSKSSVERSGKEKKAQFYDLLTRHGLEGILERKRRYGLDLIFLFTSSFIDESLGLEECCELTREHVQNSHIVNSVLSNHRVEVSVEGEVNVLYSGIEEFKSMVEEVSV